MKARAFKEPIHCARKDAGIALGEANKVCLACADVVPINTPDERWICPRTLRVKPQQEQHYLDEIEGANDPGES